MLESIDLFCGAGGMTGGLKRAKIVVRAGIDISDMCIKSYMANYPRLTALQRDISSLKAKDVSNLLSGKNAFVLAGCPPCQLFSQLHRNSRPVGEEFKHYLRLIWALRPDYLVFENVPRIVDYKNAWELLLSRLAQCGYHVASRVVSAEVFGVPQKRKRLVLLAARTPIELFDPVEMPLRTVRDAIGGYPEQQDGIPNHITMKLSEVNYARILSTPANGGRSKVKRSAFDDSYGRMSWDAPAPTITTRCISFSNGSFGHPEYNRAITVREAACLQGFDPDYAFVGGVWETARQVGNAVPPPIAAWLGENIQRHFKAQNNKLVA